MRANIADIFCIYMRAGIDPIELGAGKISKCGVRNQTFGFKLTPHALGKIRSDTRHRKGIAKAFFCKVRFTRYVGGGFEYSNDSKVGFIMTSLQLRVADVLLDLRSRNQSGGRCVRCILRSAS